MEKVIRDGKVAVLVSKGYGAGFSTWGAPDELIFNPTLINFVENNDFESAIYYVETNHPVVYTGGMSDLVIQWVPEGKRFRINEYDGFETIELEDEVEWLTA